MAELVKGGSVSTFKDNVNTFINGDTNIPNEIIKIAHFVTDNPYIIENIIEPPNLLRCIACCYNKQQCTKNKKKNADYCGIHVKGTPFGVVLQRTETVVDLNITLTDINGVLCYVDTFNNVYRAEDIIQHKLNPAIIAKWDGTTYTSLLTTADTTHTTPH
jgi:hypothetical protein